jgi:hypothetical protein
MGKSGKVIIEFEPPVVKERKLWPINPATKVFKSKKQKSRKRLKQEIHTIIRDEELEQESGVEE